MKSEQDDDLKDVMAAEKRRGRSNRPTEATQEKKVPPPLPQASCRRRNEKTNTSLARS